MRKLVVMSALIVALVALSGCCTTRNPDTGVSVESYVQTLEKIKSNLEDDLKPSMEELLAADTAHIEPWKQAKRDLMNDTITLCNDALLGDEAGRSEAPNEGGEEGDDGNE